MRRPPRVRRAPHPSIGTPAEAGDQLRSLARSDVYIVRFGAVQHGRTVTLRFTDLLAGRRQPIAMRIETYCCLGGTWDYEYRFRAQADIDAPALEHRFAAGIAWSSDEAGSIDRPE